MDNEIIMSKLHGKGHEDLRSTLCFIYYTYSNPSFGSMSKHDIDLLLFESMVNIGLISKNPTIYSVMRDLKVTRAKARNLIYEYQLRKVENEEELGKQLCDILKTPLLSRESNNVWLEIDNPYLIDFVRNELKQLGFVTDGSFHAELVKLSVEAFSGLYEKMLPNERKKDIKKQLVNLGIKPDTSLKTVLPHLIKGVGKTMAKTAMGKVGEDIADEFINYLKENYKDLKESAIGFVFQNEKDVKP